MSTSGNPKKMKGAKDDYHQTFLKMLEDMQDALKSYNVEVSDEFLVMIVKLVALDPNNKFLIKQQMVPSESDRLQKLVVDRLLGMTTLSRDIISMQIHARTKFFTREDLIYIYREEQASQTSGLMHDILEEIPTDEVLREVWYAKLIGSTIMEADMGPSTESVVVKETETALNLILPKESIEYLSPMILQEREREMNTVIHCAIALRLHFKSKNPQGYGMFIEDLPVTIQQMIDGMILHLNELQSTNITRLIRYTAVAQPYFLRHVVFRMERRAVTGEMIKIRQGLVMVHQVLIYLKDLFDEYNREAEICTQLSDVFQELVADVDFEVGRGHENGEDEWEEEVGGTVEWRNFDSKLEELYGVWRELQDCKQFVLSLNNFTDTLEEFMSRHLPDLDEMVSTALGNSRVPTEKDFFKFPVIQLPEDKYALAKRVDYREDVDPLQTSLSGFCIFSLVKGVGLIVLANPNMGIFTWKGQNYLLSSMRGAIEFRRTPDSFVRKVYAIARRWPELIMLLNLEKEAFDPATISDADRSGKTTNLMVYTDSSMQTEIHPYDSNIVENYTWNEWELRRRGLILSKIHKCRTHGTQTPWQALKHTQEVQTYPMKSTSMQTMRNQYADIPLNQFYIMGLRGLHCGIPPHVVEITQDNPMDLKIVIPSKLRKSMSTQAEENEIDEETK